MNQELYKKLCVTNILNGLIEGLSKFTRASRVAVVFAPGPDDPLMVLDPSSLLKGHEPRLKEKFFTDNQLWRETIVKQIENQPKGYLIPQKDLDLSGLISCGGYCSDFFYQLWFTDHHPDMCSKNPAERWLEQAATLLIHDYNSTTSVINASDYVLKNYSLQAVADAIVDERGEHLLFDSKIQVPPILNSVLNISKTREEGAWARGTLFFADPHQIDQIEFITRIQRHERPLISNLKHIRKLLVAVERSDRKLVSDGMSIIGISDASIPDYAIAADFRGDYGFLKLGNQKIASFYDGSFHSITREAKMVELEELLMDSDTDPESSNILFQVVSNLVHTAGRGRHGCTLVLDLNEIPVPLSGHVLEPSLSLLEPKNIALTRSLLKIDGAVHLTADSHIHGFGCLLDGKTIKHENMARGARYNSALRFSADHPNIIIVVVSSDRPVSIIHNGIEINASRHWKPVYAFSPELITLEKYINGVRL